MPWCPNCKNEYVEGVTSCVDCNCELVDSLEEAEQVDMTFGVEEATKPMQEREEGDEEFLARAQEKQETMFHATHVYQKSSEKAEDFKSSAYVLLFVGVIGIVLLVLILSGLLPISLTGMNRYLIGGVMGAMFVLFIVMGILSLRSSKTLLGKAAKEDELTKEILNWCRRNLMAETVDEILNENTQLPEEVKYFKRALYMRERISNQFLNLDENYLEQLVDDYYQEIYD